jgi:murein DD-endopeptidase MepM/ murein hydrolase activator NlpD
MPRAELLSMRVSVSFRRLTLGDERGAALLMGLSLVMIMTLLGVALFEMSTIEASLARRDVSDIQAFYCAEAQTARIYGLYAPAEDPSGKRGPQTFAPTPLALANGTYLLSGSAAVDAATLVVTVTVTCTLPDGRTRTVQRRGTRRYSTPGDRSAVVSGGLNPVTGGQEFLGGLDLPPGGATVYAALSGPWRDCGGNPLCP